MNESASTSSISKNIGPVLVIVGLLLVVLSYFLVYKDYDQKTNDIKTEISSLKTRRDYLRGLEAGRAEKEAAKEEADKESEKLLEKFDGGITVQSEMMDTYKMTQDLEIEIPVLSFSGVTEAYMFGALTSSNPNGGTGGADPSYVGQSMTYNIATTTTYDNMRKVLEYILKYEGKRKVLKNVSFGYDSTSQEISLAMQIAEYAIAGGDRKQSEVEVPEYAESVDNIFYDELLAD